MYLQRFEALALIKQVACKFARTLKKINVPKWHGKMPSLTLFSTLGRLNLSAICFDSLVEMFGAHTKNGKSINVEV